MTAANAVRGEAALRVAGETMVLRPSFQALVAAEGELGPLFALVERAAAGALSLAEMIALFWHCRHAAPERVTREMVGEAVVDAGLAQATAGAARAAGADPGGAVTGPAADSFARSAARLAGFAGAVLGWSVGRVLAGDSGGTGRGGGSDDGRERRWGYAPRRRDDRPHAGGVSGWMTKSIGW